MQSELHPVDRLAAIRQSIRELRAEATQLRAQIMTGKVSSIGDEYRAEVHPRLVIRPVDK